MYYTHSGRSGIVGCTYSNHCNHCEIQSQGNDVMCDDDDDHDDGVVQKGLLQQNDGRIVIDFHELSQAHNNAVQQCTINMYTAFAAVAQAIIQL